MRSAVLLSFLVVALAGCGGSDEARQSAEPAAAPAAEAPLADLGNVLDLRAAFNEDLGEPRLILLLSPT